MIQPWIIKIRLCPRFLYGYLSRSKVCVGVRVRCTCVRVSRVCISDSVRAFLCEEHRSARHDMKHFSGEMLARRDKKNVILIFSLKSLFLHVLLCLPWHHFYVFVLTFTLLRRTNLLDNFFFHQIFSCFTICHCESLGFVFVSGRTAFLQKKNPLSTNFWHKY